MLRIKLLNWRRVTSHRRFPQRYGLLCGINLRNANQTVFIRAPALLSELLNALNMQFSSSFPLSEVAAAIPVRRNQRP